MAVVKMNRFNIYPVAYQNPSPVLVEFWSPQCKYCHYLEEALEAVSAATGSDVYTVNCDEEKEMAAYYQIRSMPTTITIQGGQVLMTALGYQTPENLQMMLRGELPDTMAEFLKQAAMA